MTLPRSTYAALLVGLVSGLVGGMLAAGVIVALAWPACAQGVSALVALGLRG